MINIKEVFNKNKKKLYLQNHSIKFTDRGDLTVISNNSESGFGEATSETHENLEAIIIEIKENEI